MMLLMFATEKNLPPFHQAMRDEFQKGGSYGSVLLTCIGLVGLILAVYFLQKWYDDSQGVKDVSSSPAKLFGELLKKLCLSPESRELLSQIARDREIANPTAILISSHLFDSHASAWVGNQSGEDRTERLAQIRALLFGGDGP